MFCKFLEQKSLTTCKHFCHEATLILKQPVVYPHSRGTHMRCGETQKPASSLSEHRVRKKVRMTRERLCALRREELTLWFAFRIKAFAVAYRAKEKEVRHLRNSPPPKRFHIFHFKEVQQHAAFFWCNYSLCNSCMGGRMTLKDASAPNYLGRSRILKKIELVIGWTFRNWSRGRESENVI